MEVKIKPLIENLQLPTYSTPGSSGADLYAIQDDTLYMGQIKLIPLGFCIEIPQGYEAQIRPRSSMAGKGIMIPNSPGTIDADYRGEVKIIFINMLEKPYEIKAGDKVAQLVVKETNKVSFTTKEELTETFRSAGGFGSTGA